MAHPIRASSPDPPDKTYLGWHFPFLSFPFFLFSFLCCPSSSTSPVKNTSLMPPREPTINNMLHGHGSLASRCHAEPFWPCSHPPSPSPSTRDFVRQPEPQNMPRKRACIEGGQRGTMFSMYQSVRACVCVYIDQIPIQTSVARQVVSIFIRSMDRRPLKCFSACQAGLRALLEDVLNLTGSLIHGRRWARSPSIGTYSCVSLYRRVMMCSLFYNHKRGRNACVSFTAILSPHS